MRSGSKTELVTIQQASTARDATTNELVPTWSTWREPWCSAETKRGREFIEAGRRDKETIVHLRFDYLDVDGITEEMRIVWAARTYEILRIEPDHETKRSTLVEIRLSRAGMRQ